MIWPTNTNDSTATILYVLITPIIAINFIIISKTLETGLYNNNLKHLYLIITEILIIIWFVNYTPELLLKYLFYPYFIFPIFELTPLYQSSIILSVLVLLYLLSKVIFKPRISSVAYLGSYIGVITALHFINSAIISMLFYSVSCLILLLAMALNSYRITKVDILTELPSRRAFKKTLKTINGRYCIAIVDIDELYQVTQKYGLDISNQILKMIAGRCQRLGRKGFPYRYANKKFALIFYGMKLNEANKYLATLCDSIANEPFLIRGKKRPFFRPNILPQHKISEPIHISASVGVAENQPHHISSIEVLNTARQALRRAKQEQEYFASI